MTTLDERFWDRVHKGEGCWVWLGGCSGNGYGSIWMDGKMRSTHRLSFEAHHGPVPRGMLVLHACDNRRCVNPAHLRAGTVQDNARDAVERNRIRHGDAHPRAVLTADKARNMRERWIQGERPSALATAFGVSDAAVTKVIHGQSWRRAPYVAA